MHRHRIERLDPSVRSAIRAQTYRNLADFASGGNHGPLSALELFCRAADSLVDSGVIDKPRWLKGQRFAQVVKKATRGFPNYEIPSNIANLMRQTFWELYLQGVLAPAPKKNPHFEPAAPEKHDDWWLCLDEVMLTPYGVSVLIDSQNRIQVHDPDGYLANFYGANPPPDPVMMRYLTESISVFRSSHLMATVVLLGIASERLVDILAEDLRDSTGNAKGDAWYNEKYKNKSISDKFKAVSGKLLAEYGPDLAQEQLKDAFQGIVTLTFEEIRHARNDIAHPIGREFTWNEVNGLLFHFVQYFRYVNQIRKFLADRM